MMKVGERFYYIAQVCLNGHAISGSLESVEDAQADFCEECGKRTIITCQGCKTPIQGWIYNPHVAIAIEFTPPSFCVFCGKAFPWTVAKKKALKELIDFETDLTKEDKKVMKSTIDDIINETPGTKVAALKFKHGLAKVGKEAAKAFRDILVDIASETGKKIILGSVADN